MLSFHRSTVAALGLLGYSLTLTDAADHRDAQNLFNGKDLAGWRQPTGEWKTVKSVSLDPQNEKQFTVQAGTGVLLNHASSHTVNLISETEHGDVEAHIEFVVPKGSNSGVYFQGRYEIQILDSWGVEKPKYGDCGGVYASCSEPKPDFSGRPPNVNASKPPGEWQTYDIIFEGPRWEGTNLVKRANVTVFHNGVVLHHKREYIGQGDGAAGLPHKALAVYPPPHPPDLFLQLQGHGTTTRYRNIWIRPLGDYDK